METEFERGKFEGLVLTKLDAILKAQTDQERRIRILERFRWVLLGLAAAAGVGSASIVKAFF